MPMEYISLLIAVVASSLGFAWRLSGIASAGAANGCAITKMSKALQRLTESSTEHDADCDTKHAVTDERHAGLIDRIRSLET